MARSYRIAVMNNWGSGFDGLLCDLNWVYIQFAIHFFDGSPREACSNKYSIIKTTEF